MSGVTGTSASAAVAWRVRLGIRRDTALAVVQWALGGLVVVSAVGALTWWQTSAAAIALGLTVLPAPIMTMVYLTGPMTRDEETGATRVLLAAAVPARVIARTTANSVALVWVVLGGASAGVAALGVWRAGDFAGTWAAFLGAVLVAGPLLTMGTARLAVSGTLLRGVEIGLIAVWSVLVCGLAGVTLVATGLVTASWPLLAVAAMLAGCVWLGVWGLSGELNGTRILARD